MDRMPSSAGGAPDGAFERFLTAAIATIVTIMFSWRLLAEEEEASGATGSNSSRRKALQYSIDKNSNFRNKSVEQPKLKTPRLADLRNIDLSLDEGSVSVSRPADDPQIVHEDVVYDRHVNERPLEAVPVADESLSSVSSADDSLTGDTLTTWDEYKWEEETGEEESCVIKTRRTVRDFVSNPNMSLNVPVDNEVDCLEPQSLSFGASPLNNPALSPSVPFSQRFANFEYKDTGGDSGYIDLYPDVESDDDTDSSDNERVYDIQVSDSDSDSEERGGAFYGVTALDTIMEEYESDASDPGGQGHEVNARAEGGQIGDSDKTTVVGENKSIKSFDNIYDISKVRKHTGNNGNSSVNDTYLITSETIQNVASNGYENDQITKSNMLPNKIEINSKCQPLQSETPLRRTEVNEFESDLMAGLTDGKDVKLTTLHASQSKTTPTDTVCDMNINDETAVKSYAIQCEVSEGSNVNIENTKIHEEICKSKLSSQSSKKPENQETMILKLVSDDYKISEISDDSLPASPVRTCALDNFSEELFSDTESCSSESVITVLSVKSNDSDNYTDRNNNANSLQSNLPVINVDQASGEHLSSVVSDQTNDELGKYESYSLVSGFLNDSLNSLLSANTGSIENESDADSSSGREIVDQEFENQSETVNMNGKVTSDESCLSSAESLQVVEEVTQINAYISENGHIDSSDSLNTEHDQNPTEYHAHQGNTIDSHRLSDSDNSSDSSDPPLREYDPDDDDLAAFQFNLDSDDDSFFLVIADDENDDDEDEGKLRNFQTFTNLNSVGLSPEYGDAVTSHTLSDDAKGFKFSHTEDISTQFKKRSYFTDRANLSDSDTRSDGPLSPITSEDEENKSEESTEKPISESVNQDHFSSPLKTPNLSTYADAEISTANSSNETENESNKTNSVGEIDFNKYIIHTELSPILESVPFPEEESAIVVKELTEINKDDLIQDLDHKFVINSAGDKTDTLSVKEMNNLQHPDETVETLSSLTEKIERLTEKSAKYEEISDSNNESEEKLAYELTEFHDADNEDVIGDTENDTGKDRHKITPRETLIDDVSSENSSFEQHEKAEESEADKKKRTHVETNIDDIFDNSEQDLKSRSHSKIETNIDDILNESSGSEKEITRQTRKSNRTRVTPSKPKIETNIDDIFDENFTAAAVVPVHSTPLKTDWKTKRETNIDELFEDNNLQSKVNSKQKSKLETSVDDLLNDLNSVNIATGESVKAKQNRLGNSGEDLESKNLSYETFVDDLFDNARSEDSSQKSAHANDAGSVITSESAIYLDKSREPQSPKRHPKGVQPENISDSLKYEHNNRLRFNIEDTVKKTNDPRQTDIVHVEKIVNVDTDIDNSLDKIEKDTKDFKDKTAQSRHEIGTNYRKIYEEPEKSNNGTQSHTDLVDNEVSLSKSLQNTDKQKRGKNRNNVTESVETNLAQNFEKDNRDQLQNNLNTSQLDFKDHNVSISLPKTESLKNVKQNTHIGHSPGKDNRYNYKRGDIISAEQPCSLNAENNVENITQSGVKIDDSLLKSEEECDTNDEELKIVENSDDVEYRVGADENQDSNGACSEVSDEESLNSFDESFNSLQDSYNILRLRGLSDSEVTSRVVRSPVTKPSDFLQKSKDLKGVKKKVFRHNLKKYTSILQQPVTPERVNITFENPHRPPSISRLKVIKSREKFLSAENLSPGSFEDKFLQHRTSLASTPRKYLKRHEIHRQSTESLPSDMAAWNTSYGSDTSMDNFRSLPSPRRIEELYGSRYSSANSSFEKAEYDKLHANCMFSPGKREEIRHTKESLEHMFEQLLRYGSVSSLATETDLDADVTDDVNTHGHSLQDTYYISFQYPLERAASMSAITGPSESHRLPRKPGKGRFANRKVPKSKSLQTLETNLDDVFADESDQPGKLSRTPSEHELRVSKSLSKLNVPDWFRKSSFSRSGSTQSLFTYARSGSTSTIGSSAYPPSLTTSPSPSVTPNSNTVIIQKRVTPTNTMSPSARLLRAPMLPTTPEKSPIHNTPPLLPSDRYRKQEKKDNLKPIAIVPFAKLREMFEKKAQDDAKSKSPVTSPTESKSPVGTLTKEKPPVKVRFEHASPTKETVIHDSFSDHKPVQNNRTISPPPPVPERKPILTDHSAKHSDSSAHAPRRTQVHFSDENHVSRSQEQNTNSLRQNGTASNASSSTSSKPVKKPQSLRAALPQFRFRRPGRFASPASAATQSSSENKKGKNIADINDIEVNSELVVNDPPWLHALELKTKTDGETLFEFLQKRRYSSILENGFAEQLDELQDRTFNFPVMTLGRHSNQNGDLSLDGSPDLQVILTNAHANNVSNGYLENKLRSDASADEILDGLLLLDGHRTGRMRIGENGRIVPRTPDDWMLSPDTPPGLSLNLSAHEFEHDPSVCRDGYVTSCVNGMDYMLVKCEYSGCTRETNLKEAKQYFKSCHSCITYYCSRNCRKLHWDAHKQVCIYSRINSACKHVIKYINRQPHLQYQCSRIARRGYLAQGRGCVVFAFPDISSSEDFLIYGMESLWVPPVYIALKELPHASMLGSKLGILTDTCKQYNPELKYVIHVAIVIPPKLPVKPVPRRMESIIQKSAKLRLSPAHMHPKQEDADIPSTLILTAVPGNQHADESDDRKTRELCFVNIQRKLRNRGVSLRHQFAEIYNKLIDFVSDAKHFSPMIIYPTDNRTGKRFMCVIMPEAEPEIEWIRDPDLFHELDVFDDEGPELSTSNMSILQQSEIML